MRLPDTDSLIGIYCSIKVLLRTYTSHYGAFHL